MRDYAETVKALRCCSTIDAHNNGCDSCPYEYCGEDCQKVCGYAADAIEELLAKVESYENQRVVESEMVDEMYAENERLKSKVPHWISVEEQLPDDFSRVLGFMAWGGMMLLERQSKGWYLADRIQQAPDEAVLYWMPLPKAPKED